MKLIFALAVLTSLTTNVYSVELNKNFKLNIIHTDYEDSDRSVEINNQLQHHSLELTGEQISKIDNKQELYCELNRNVIYIADNGTASVDELEVTLSIAQSKKGYQLSISQGTNDNDEDKTAMFYTTFKKFENLQDGAHTMYNFLTKYLNTLYYSQDKSFSPYKFKESKAKKANFDWNNKKKDHFNCVFDDID